MSKPFQIEDISEEFNKHFKLVTFGYEKIPYDVEFAHSFFASFNDDTNLSTNWSKFSNFIALHFISKLEKDFEKWNTYIFYSCKAPIPRDLQYKIENDTFGSRKICVPHDVEPTVIIEDHILNTNLNTNFNDTIFSKRFVGNPIIQKALSGKNIRRKRTDDVVVAYEEIIKSLKAKV